MYKTASRYLQHRARYPKKPKTAQPRGKKTSAKKLPKSLRRAFSAKQPIIGTVISFNKGGFAVDSHGVRAFCPFSLMYPPTFSDSDKAILIGRRLEFVVEKIVPRVVLSRRTVVRKYTLEKIKKAAKTGQSLDGRIINVMPYGAFVDLGAVDGLLHISEIADGWVDKIDEILQPGMAVRVMVLDIGDGGKRVSLSMRQVPR